MNAPTWPSPRTGALVLGSSEKGRLGLRRTETARLDLADWGVISPRRRSADSGMLHVRHGKAVRGRSPRRRNVASVTVGGGGGGRQRREHPLPVPCVPRNSVA